MNADELASCVRKLLLMGLTAAATRWHLDGEQLPAVAADLTDLGVFGWALYAHWGMKKVPETAHVVAASPTA